MEINIDVKGYFKTRIDEPNIYVYLDNGIYYLDVLKINKKDLDEGNYEKIEYETLTWGDHRNLYYIHINEFICIDVIKSLEIEEFKSELIYILKNYRKFLEDSIF